MTGRDDRDRFLVDIDARKDPRCLRNARQPLLNDRRVQMLEVKMDVIVVSTDAAALTDFDGHRTAYYVARRQIFC